MINLLLDKCTFTLRHFDFINRERHRDLNNKSMEKV